MTLLDLSHIAVRYPLPHGGSVTAVNDVSLEIGPGETLSIVGESGCGKSSLARAVVGLVPLAAGKIRWQGEDIAGFPRQRRQDLKRRIQIIFQDPLASLDPRMTIGAAIAEPLSVFEPQLSKRARGERVAAMLAQVELPVQLAFRLPHEISGGQCQRAAIARALILRPDLLVCDEAVSALDVSVQAQIINLLRRIQSETGLSLLFVSHNLGIVRRLGHRVAVLYLGRVAETATAEQLFANPQHPYTKALLSAALIPDPAVERVRHRMILTGEPPSPASPPSGCVFRTRCPEVIPRCTREVPGLIERTPGHAAACLLIDPTR